VDFLTNPSQQEFDPPVAGSVILRWDIQNWVGIAAGSVNISWDDGSADTHYDAPQDDLANGTWDWTHEYAAPGTYHTVSYIEDEYGDYDTLLFTIVMT